MADDQQAKAKGVVDIVFVMDVSGSMDPSIKDLASNVALFIDSLTHADPNGGSPVKDWRAKVFGFRDVNNSDAPAFVDNPFVRDSGALRMQLDALKAVGGGDEPESALDALYKVATMGNTERDAPEEATKWRYRSSAARVAILFTDASCHMQLAIPEARGGSMQDLFNVLMANRIILNIFAPDMPCWDELSQVQRSEYMPITYDKTAKYGPVFALRDFTKDPANFQRTLKALAASVSKSAETPEL
jgi:von Willebrand factor type A domain